jgi:hypothetical protein
MMRHDLELFIQADKPKPFEIVGWLDANIYIVRLFVAIARMDCQRNVDPKLENVKIETTFLSLFSRYADYLSFALDVMSAVTLGTLPNDISSAILAQISSRGLRDKFQAIVAMFVKCFSILPHHLTHLIINENILKLLPNKKHHQLHRLVHQEIIANLRDPTLYYSAFFGAIANNFDELFQPECSRPLLELIQSTYQEAFIPDGTQSPQTQQQSALPFGNELFEFVLKVICSKRSQLYELLFSLFHVLVQNPNPPKLGQYFLRFKQLPFSMSNLLRYLSEDPKDEAYISLLAIFVYPFCQDQQADVWANLFIQAMQSDHMVRAVWVLYSQLLRTFPQWIEQLKKPAQIRFVSALAATMNRLGEKDVVYPRRLLSEIADLFANYCVMLHDFPPGHEFIQIEGQTFSANFILNAVRQSDIKDEELLRNVYCQLLCKSDFFHVLTNKFTSEFVAFLEQQCPNAIKNADDMFNNEAVSIHLFIKHHIFRENVVGRAPDPRCLLLLCLEVCSCPGTARTAVSLIDSIMEVITPPMQLISRTQTALVHASVYDYKAAKGVIEKRNLAVHNQHGGRLTLAKKGIDECSYPVGMVGLSPATADCNGRPFVF